MSYFKRFTDFCAGFTAFHAIIYIIGQFMSFRPAGDVVGILDKLKLFLAKDHPKSHREYIILIALLILSVIVGRIFEKLPYVSMLFSLLPMMKIILMFCDDKLRDRPMLYIILGVLHVAGNVVHAAVLDRADGKRRAFVSTNLFGVAAFSLGLALKMRAEKLALLGEEARVELGALDLKILDGVESGIYEVVFKLGLFVLISVVVSLILRDIYFIDAILAIFPLALTVYMLNADKLTAFPAIILAVVFLYFAFRVLVLVAEPMAKKFSLPWKKNNKQEI
ncbi:MAG: hypothetical protein J6A83_08560 [Clostridia bacterium]|nr:hypothetical protein [Clostridia bacterium]